VHASGTLSQILGIRLRSGRGIFSYKVFTNLILWVWTSARGQVHTAYYSYFVHTTTRRATIVCNTTSFEIMGKQAVSQSHRMINLRGLHANTHSSRPRPMQRPSPITLRA
jgi:hypothetical protein